MHSFHQIFENAERLLKFVAQKQHNRISRTKRITETEQSGCHKKACDLEELAKLPSKNVSNMTEVVVKTYYVMKPRFYHFPVLIASKNNE